MIEGVAVVLLLLVFLDIPNYVHLLVEPLVPKYFYFLFAAIVVPLVLSRGATALAIMRSPFVVWVLVLVALNFAHLTVAWALADQARAALIVSQTQFVVLALVLGSLYAMLRPSAYAYAFPVACVAIVVLVVVDFLAPGTLYPVDTEGGVIGRAAGTFVNPNKAGEAILLTLLLGFPVLRRGMREVLLVIAGIGAVLTFSRAAILAWVLLWGFLALLRSVSRVGLVALAAALIAMPAIFASLESYLGERADLAIGIENLQDRLDFFQTRDLGDESSLERRSVLDAGVELYLANPLVGAGAMSTYVWTAGASTHNTPVLLAAEYGVVGIGLWIALVFVLWHGGYFRDRALQGAAALGVLFLSLFTHNMFDSLHWLLSFVLLSQRWLEEGA